MPSTKNPDEIVVGVDGEIYIAPEGTTLPTTEASSLDAAFKEVGYTSEAGVTLNRSQTIEDIKVWQSRYPARRIVNDEVLSAAFAMRQWNKASVETAFSAQVVTNGAGHFKATPLPASAGVVVHALAIDWHDGDKDFRLVVPRCIVTANGDIQVARTQAADLPVTLSVLAEEGGGDPWMIFTNDDAFSS